MSRKKKAEELISEVIKKISNREAISTSVFLENKGVSESSFNERFKDVRDNFYEYFIKHDKSTGKWIHNESLFLEKMLLVPEETVVLTGILRNKAVFGEELIPWVEKIVDNYVKRTKTSVFKQDILERIDEDLESIFAQIKYSIDKKRKIKFKYNDGHIIMYPYKIINLEYYWYILGYEEYSEYWIDVKEQPKKTKKVKTFTIAKIRSLEVLEDTYEYDFTNTELELKNVMNAYFSVDDGSKTIELLVINWLEDYISRAPYFSGWKKTGATETFDDNELYLIYEIKSSNKYYSDIIPTILKYAPNIRIRNDEELVKRIFKELDTFAHAHNRKIEEIEN